ncbi:MAG: hypothetical protein WKF75_10550 [Singulisphaera sp.]
MKKLVLLGQGVEPDGFEVGPTFARLRVRPVGKTNFKMVCNKAVDLRISLGLEVVPIVGSQAGCISIDVQRPDRAVVSLAAAAGRSADGPGRDAGLPRRAGCGRASPLAEPGRPVGLPPPGGGDHRQRQERVPAPTLARSPPGSGRIACSSS